MAARALAFGLLALALRATEAETVPGDPARFKYISMKTPLSGPCDVSEGTDGLVYINEALADKFARYNQYTGQLDEFDIPFTADPISNATIPLPGNAKAFVLTCAIRNGYDGKMYFSNGIRNQLVQFDARTEKIRIFTPTNPLNPVGNLQPLNDLTTAPDGVYMTQTSQNTIVKFDYITQKFTYFQIPTPGTFSIGIYYGSDGGIWFLEFTNGNVGRLDRKTGKIEEFPSRLLAGALPTVIRGETRDVNGDYLLWFPAALGSSLCNINERTKKVTCFPEGLVTIPLEVAQDYQNNLWIAHASQNTLGVFNPRYQNFTQIIVPGTVVPGPIGVPPYVGIGIYSKPIGNPFTRGTGNAIWFTQVAFNRLVRYDLNGLKY